MMLRLETRRCHTLAVVLGAALLTGAPAHAQSKLSPLLVPMDFLLGNWVGDTGHAEGGQAVAGTSVIEAVTGGNALLRHDHTQVFGVDGRVAQSFEQIMLIYPEAGHLRADYFDGTHAIHYVDVATEAGASARFTSAQMPGAPIFRLTYTRQRAGRIGIRFEMRPPGSAAFQLIAEGRAHKAVLMACKAGIAP